MNEVQNIIAFFNELRLNFGYIWVENNSIKFSAPKKFQNQETDDFIRSNKSQIIFILVENGVFSKEKFQSVIIYKDKTQKAYPLSPAQERLWFIEQFEEGTNAYHIPEVFELGIDTNKEGIKYALQQIISRHEVLRSTIEQEENQEHGIQIVHNDPLPMDEIVFSDMDNYELSIRQEINKPFNLSKEYPIRVTFYTIASAKTLLLVNLHHIASDGWSREIFIKELFLFYEAHLKQDFSFRLPDLEIQYKDYALWQRSYIKSEELKNQLNYWKQKLEGYQSLELPTDYVRPSRINYKGNHKNFAVNDRTTIKLRALAKRNGVTLNSVILSCINVLFSKYTGQDDIVIGSVNANRQLRQTNDVIGFFINTQVNRTLLNKDQSFEELIQKVHNDQIEAQSHQDLPFEKLVDALGVERDSSRHPVFQVMFSMDSFGNQEDELADENNYLIPCKIADSNEIEKFDLSIFINEINNELYGQISFATSLFHSDTISRLVEHFVNILDELAESPNKPYSEINLLKGDEYTKIVQEWNQKDLTISDGNESIVKQIENYAQHTPDVVAVLFEGIELSYKELNEKSNQVARYIREKYIAQTGQPLTPDTFVALFLDRSIEMIIGIIAVLKAGGAYVPIDPSYPQDRIDYILEDIQTEIIITQQHLLTDERIVLPNEKIIKIDLGTEIYTDLDAENLGIYNQKSALCYVIYTSGTTGKPKGVMVEQHQIISFVKNNNFIDYEKVSVIGGISNYVFDGSVFDIFFSLFNGKCLLLIGKDNLLDLVKLDKQLEEFGVDTIFVTTALFNSLVQNKSKCLANLRQILFGGERCNLETINNFKKSYQTTELIHVYGPTENIVFSTFCHLGNYNSTTVAPIGRHLADKYVYVLDSNKTPVPLGVVGELFIGGYGVARGYLNRPELTSSHFISNPFADDYDHLNGYNRLYKTGDLVKWLPDGNIEYIGRNDDQVKIRGHRIELKEIEYYMSQIEEIQQVCVSIKERNTEAGNTKYIVAYYVLNSFNLISKTVILDRLIKLLPEYMIPGAFVEMDSFPLTINGKINKRVLPDPDFSSSPDEYVAPTTELETIVCKIWKLVLGIDRVSITDNFFRIGGDSILSIQVSSRIRQEGYSCQVKDIFEYKTIEKLAKYLSNKNTELHYLSEQGILSGEMGLLPVQRWFTDQIDSGAFPDFNIYNQSFLIRVPDLDLTRLEKVIDELVSYHDLLRVNYIRNSASDSDHSVWKQAYQPEIRRNQIQTLNISKYSKSEVYEILSDWQSCFDIENGSLFQFGYINGYTDGSARIYVAIHHLIVDGITWRILSEDIQTLYEGRKLPLKGSSYRQWVNSVKEYPNQNRKEDNYWEEQLKNMPLYQKDSAKIEIQEDYFALEELATLSLLHDIPKAYNTEINDLLLTALAYSLKDINQSDIQGITLEGHGREDIDTHIDHSRTLGWFTTMFPVKLEIRNTIGETIQFIKETLRSIPNKGIGFGAFAIENGSSFDYSDLPKISFNYLGQFDAQKGDWQIISEESGNNISRINKDHNLIIINGMISDGKLCFGVNTRLGKSITEKLAESFHNHLSNINEYCKDKIENEGSSFTPSDFGTVKISQLLLNRLELQSKKNNNEIVQIYPASSLQQGFIYHALSQPEDDAYRIQVLFDYHQQIDTVNYIKAWEHCIAQFPILRTAFNWDENIVQIIYKYGKLVYQIHDISQLNSKEEKDDAIEKIQQEDRKKEFDLSNPSLFRLHIIKQTESFYTVLKNVHHSIIDGWSESILLTTMNNYYTSFNKKNVYTQKEDGAYFKTQEYIFNHKNTLLEYWKINLSQVESTNDINSLLDKPINLTTYRKVENTGSSSLVIDDELYQLVKEFSQKEGVTINVIIQFLWHKLIQVYSNNLISIVGTTVSGRDIPIEGIEESVGLYINTLPLIINWENDNTVLLQLHEIQQKVMELNSHSFAELAKLQKDGARIFHTLFVYENFPTSEDEIDAPKISIRNVIEKGEYPFGLTVYEQDSIVIKLTYDSNYVSEIKVKSHLQSLKEILLQLINKPYEPHHKITLLDANDYDKIVFKWNETDTFYANEKTLIDLFHEQVINSPDAIALVFEGNVFSYQEVNEQSDKLAHYLKTKYPLKSNDLIGIMLNRSEKMFIAILGILKAGCAYVSIDPEYLEERKKYIIEDTALNILISETDYIFDLGFYSGNLFAIDIEFDFIEAPVTPVNSIISPTDLAYVIYTSGTTGVPKGVMINHSSVVNYFYNVKEVMLSDVQNVDFSTNIAFDLSVTTTICSLLLGKKIVIYSGQLNNSDAYTQYLINNRIDFIKGTPSLLGSLNPDIFSSFKIKQAFVGGEKLDDSHLANISKYVDTVIDEYGPTEATVGTTYIHKTTGNSGNIGKSYFNCKTYVLDPNQNPLPIGVIGELYIGGAGIAQGYLNQKELTNERFIFNLFATETDKIMGYDRLYKTGDLVKWLPDGNLEYISRNDNQVKIRGFRVELGEIENVFSQITGIKQSCVLAKERKTEMGISKFLIAFYVLDETENSTNLDQTAISEKLKQYLPDYMLPGSFMKLNSFPLTRNGKLDKSALLEIGLDDFSVNYIAPTNEIEAKICSIWQEILGIERIGISDDFFKIGGDSILSIQFSSRIRQIGYRCQVKDIFEYKTISKLGEYLMKNNLDVTIQSEQGVLKGELDLLPVQKWFFMQVNNHSIIEPNYFNHSFLIKVPQLDIHKLEKSIEELMFYHDALKIGYTEDDSLNMNELKQFYNVNNEFQVIKTLDISQHNEKEVQDIITSWQNGFNIKQGSLFQTGYLFGFEDGTARIFIALHHLIVDVVSWRILSDDLKTLYEGRKLPEKGTSYRQWGVFLENYPARYASEASYWENQLNDLPGYSSIIQKQESHHIYVELDKALTKSLLQETSKAYNTEINDLLLTALTYALKELNQNYIQGITLEGHGREDIDSSIDHSRTIGWFTTMFPVRLVIKDNLEDTIFCIKETLRNIPNKGLGFGVFASNDSTTYSQNDLPQICFNYLGQFEIQNEFWQITSEESGESVSKNNSNNNLINVNGVVRNGKIGFSIITKLGEKDTLTFSETYKAVLTKIILHCKGNYIQKGTQYTPSDFQDFTPYEIINPHLEENPIFIFPPGSSGAESYYNNIVPKLPNRKIVLFNNYYIHRANKGIDNDGLNHEKLAEYYKSWVFKIQPKGNYTFLGWSFGGIVAFEVLRQLMDGKTQYNNLILLDSWFSQKEAAKGMPEQYLQQFSKNINYDYNPICNLDGVNIVLFKATINQDITEHFTDHEAIKWCEKYYLNNHFNGLDVIFSNYNFSMTDKVTVIKLNCNHNNILELKSDIISDYLLSIQNESLRDKTELQKY